MTVLMKTKGGHRTTTPAHELTEFHTPSEKLFVVYHMGVPAMDPDTWQLTVGGLVENSFVLTLSELNAMEKIEVLAFHECAGNPLKPTTPVRRVGNVRWRGVQLRRVLEKARIRSEARFVWSRGADSGIYARTGTYSDCYLKDLPLEKALCDEVLLATELNREPLSDEHGAPVRLIVPGYYGTNSVKWLTAIWVERTRADGFYTTKLYNDHILKNGIEHIRPVWAVAPHSVIVSPRSNQLLALEVQHVWGWAWSADEIRTVEVSTDGGIAWKHAQVEPPKEASWQRFTYEWMPQAPGEYVLACRSTDRTGVVQPTQNARNQTFQIKVHITTR